ncbi:MAG: S8 family peptidase [Mycobacteriales bacterium]
MRGSLWRRISTCGAAAAAPVLLAALLAAPASADRPTGSAGAPAKAKAAPVSVAPTRLTLLTGDVVTYGRDGKGRVSIATAPAAGREDMTFQARGDGDHYYVVPADAQPYVTAGLLDRELFDVAYLATHGYADGAAGQLPLIVQYQPGLRAAAALPAATATTALPAIDGAAVRVDKKQAGGFWTAVRGTAADPHAVAPRAVGPDQQPTQLGAGLRKVWLDGKVAALDTDSDTQIGAPTAWAAGYQGAGVDVGIIDTGIDTNHPDLAGKVVAAQNFVPAGSPGGGDPADVTDRFGHGTHVASIIAGTGAASAGRYQGVVPQAKLYIAKALDDGGAGYNSAILAAMQWQAATQHARIVSMSLGGEPTDGTDPLSQAVDDLTAQYGTLFVIAAGNSGPGHYTVAAPGAATAALTVGAVDRTDHMASFSSRGPRVGGGYGVKPEVTAPGVNIVAARAAGTSLGAGSSIPGDGPVDQYYTAASGTSMATPHVAGAAAILLQQHPDWTAAQVKTALIGTAHDTGGTVYDQGAGRIDVARAVTQHVFADTASVSTVFTYPYTGQASTTKVTYRNTGDTPVTLALSASLATVAGAAAPAGMATASPSSLTVPAGGTASTDLTLDPTVGTTGLYSGLFVATDPAGDRVSVPIGFYKGAKQDTLTVRVVGGDRDLRFMLPATAIRVSDTIPALASEPTATWEGGWRQVDTPNTYQVSLRLAEGGVYSLDTALYWLDPVDGTMQVAYLDRPEVKLDGDTTVTLDLAKLARIRIRTPRPSEADTFNMATARSTAGGVLYTGASVFSYPSVAHGGFWMLPTDKPTVGTFQAWFDEVAGAPQATVTLSGRHGLTLHPRYVWEWNDRLPKFTTDTRTGTATEADLRAGSDVRGRLVFVEPATLDALLADLDQAKAGGAAGIITESRLSWVLYDPYYRQHTTIPLLWIDGDQAAQLRSALAGGARPGAAVDAQVTSPYEYKLVFYVHDRIPARLEFSPAERDLSALDTVYHAQYAAPAGTYGPGPDMDEVDHTFGPGQVVSIKAAHSFTGPARRVEYYSTTGPDVRWDRDYNFWDTNSGGSRYATSIRAFAVAAKGREDWDSTMLPSPGAVGPAVPAALLPNIPCDACRQGDTLRLRTLSALGLGMFTDAADPSHLYQAESGQEDLHLYRGDTEIAAQSDGLGLSYYTLPAGSATYRFTDTFTDGFTGPHTGTAVTSTWTFHSARPTGTSVADPYHCLDTELTGDTDPCAWVPLVTLSYALGLDTADTLPAGHPVTFTITPHVGAPASAARLASLRLWTSTDGTHWQPALVVPQPDHSYRAIVLNPPTPGTAVSLRVEASDPAGNAVQQTITTAYHLR